MYGEIEGAMGASVGLGTERLCAGTTAPPSTKARPHQRNDSTTHTGATTARSESKGRRAQRIDRGKRIDNQEISRKQ